MDIPKSLESTWKQVAQDGKITKADYEKLIKAAAPTGKEAELDDAENKFLSSLKSDLEKNGGAKGSVPVENISFSKSGAVKTEPVKIATKDFGEVPQTLREAWGRAIEDGEINAADYKFLLDVAAPNWNDNELDDKERDFLANLKSLLNKSNNLIQIAPSAPVTAKSKTDTVTENVKEGSSDTVNNNVKPETKAEDQPVKTLADMTGSTDSDLEQLNQVKSILDSLKDEPDFAPLRGIVESRIQNNQLSKQYSATINEIIKGIEPGKSESLTAAKVKLDAEYTKLPENIKNNAQIKQVHDDSNNYIEIAMSQLSVKNTAKPVKSPKNHQAKLHHANKPAVSAKAKNTATNSDVPATLKNAWEAAIKDGNITQSDFDNLMKAAAPNKKNSEFDDKELAFMGKLKENLDAHNGIISFVDNPDDVAVSTDSKSTTAASAASGPGQVPANLKPLWEQLTSDGKLKAEDFDKIIKAAAPNDKPEELDPAETAFLSSIKAKFLNEDGSAKDSIDVGPAASMEASASQPSAIEDVPPSLKEAWSKIQEKGELTRADYNQLISVAAPNGDDAELDEKEQAFLETLKQKLAGKASVSLTTESAGNQENKPVLLNWPGYTKETKNALRNAFGGQVIGSDMPVLPTRVGKQVATAFGVSNISDLQRMINAKVDGKFGPETFFKAKVFIASHFNQEGAQPEQLNKMLQVLGNDPEVTRMKKSLGEPTTASAKKEAASEPKTDSSDGIPSTMKATWDQVTADGKLTADDFEKLIKAAAPNKKNSEFDDEELNFIAEKRAQLAASNGVLTIDNKAPVQNSQPKSQNTAKANIDLGGINPNDQTAVSDFQKKLNLLTAVFENASQSNFPKVPIDGKISPEFVKGLADFQAAVGQSPVKAVMETEAALKQELGMPQIDNRSARFIVFQDNDFKILGNVKDVTRVETAKTLMAKMGINIGTYKMEYPENPAKNGDIKLVGNGVDITVFDNLQAGRNSNSFGDFHVQGKVNGKSVDIAYWENQRRSADAIKNNGLFNLKTKIDGVESQQKSEQGFLPSPLVRINKK